jgi:2-polyprenyl-3-methyl-5-hydroxy-6-metoxy-1,4-benzoquinol methylase
MVRTGNLSVKEQCLDVILCLDVLEHLVDPEAVIRRLHRLLALAVLCSRASGM